MSNLKKLEWQRNYRKLNNNFHTKQYEKSIPGFLMRTYRNMKSRVTGVQKLKAHLYLGKELLEKEEFYSWATTNADFLNLYKTYTENNFNIKLCPSIDRIDSTKGYTLDNMRWLTQSENSKFTTKGKKYGKAY